MSDESWNTAITKIKANEVRLRGYRIDQLMGEVTFTQAIYLALKGELPSTEVGRLLDAILVSSIDHGATPPSALAARTAASTGAPLNAALAAGVLSINRLHGGAIYDCMGVIQEGLEQTKESETTFAIVAEALVADYSARKKRIAGLGHRIHSNDPRTSKLFTLAEELKLAGDGVAMMQAIQGALLAKGKQLPINVDGAIASLLIDIDMPREVANAFFIMARVPGLVAHIQEELRRERPMRRIHPTDHGYDGPSAREL